MENKKDIGKAFREKLDLLDKSPGNRVWDAIATELDQKKRKAVPLWLKITGISVVVLLVFLAADALVRNHILETGQPHATEKNDGINTIVDSNTAGNANGNSNDSAESQSGDKQNVNVTSDPEGSAVLEGNAKNDAPDAEAATNSDTKSSGKNTAPKDNTPYDKISEGVSHNPGKIAAKKRATRKNSNAAASKLPIRNGQTLSSKKKRKTIKNHQAKPQQKQPSVNIAVAASEYDGKPKLAVTEITRDSTLTASDSLAKKSELKKPKKKEEKKDSIQTAATDYGKFSVFLYGAPTFYNHFSKKSSIDRSLDSIPGHGETTFSFGGYLSLALDEKWTVRIGISRTDYRFTSGNITLDFENSSDLSHVDYAPGIDNGYMLEYFIDAQTYTVRQDFSYWEFPIEVKYNLFKKAVFIDAIGGISTLLLKENKVTAIDNLGTSLVLGSTENRYRAHFSGNIGLGFYYRFARNFQFNLEPMFKYQFKAGEINQKPYSIVLQTGIEYTFGNGKNSKKTKK